MAPDNLPPEDLPFDVLPGAVAQEPRQTLAMRLAARNRQRELRAERLARLHGAPVPAPTFAPALAAPPVPEAAPVAAAIPEAGAGSAPAPGEAAPAAPGSVDAAEAALEAFLRTLTGALPPLPEGPPVEPGELLPFQRPDEPAAPAPAASDLDRLPGVGPGLVWALGRAGIARLADLAPLEPSDLATRLGPLGRLVPTERWIATAREAEA